MKTLIKNNQADYFIYRLDYSRIIRIKSFNFYDICCYMKTISEPLIAPVNTTIQGGNFQYTSILNRIEANAKSIGLKIELVQIGLYKAEINIPTTAAFTPIIAPLMFGLFRKLSQNGNAPRIRRNAGKKTAIVAINPPCHPFMTAPKYAANVNSGPGTACVAP